MAAACLHVAIEVWAGLESVLMNESSNRAVVLAVMGDRILVVTIAAVVTQVSIVG